MEDSLFTFNFSAMSKKGIFTVVVFLITLILCDYIFGGFSKMLFYSQKTGKFARLSYIVKSDTSDIIVLGSSHAMRHFIPEIIQDSLHESAFNYGTMGQKLLFNRAVYEIRKRRSKPKMIILDVDADWFFDRHNQQDRMADLFPYYERVGDIIFRDFSRKDRFFGRLKCLSKTVQFNSTIVHVIEYKLKPQDDFSGYGPLFGVVDSLQLELKLDAETATSNAKFLQPVYDSSLVNLFAEFIDDIKMNDIRLVVVFSPDLLKPDYVEKCFDEKVKEICRNKTVRVIDFSNSHNFNNNRLLFNDFGHLNDSGARVFTKILCTVLR
jgi:hypothetical protein